MKNNLFFKYFFSLICCFSIIFTPLIHQNIISKANANLFEFGINDEKELGQEFEVLVKAKLPLVEDPAIKLYIVDLMEKILKQVPPQPFRFEANVLYSQELNAFASPGGFIFIFTGLLTKLENESQLAGIMAHEIAHVTQRHIANRIDRSKYLTLATLAGMILGALAGGDGAGAAVSGSAALGQAAQLNYSRHDENDADRFGLQYMIDAGYNPNGLAESFEILQNNTLGVGSNFPSYLSTHPALTSRIASTKSYIITLPSDIVNRKPSNSAFLRAKALTMAYFADKREADAYFINPKTAIDYMGKAIVASKRNKIQDAKTAFTRAIQMTPNDYLINRETGRFYFEIGEFKESRRFLLKAIQLNPKDYMAIYFYARLLDAEKSFLQAQSYYLQVLKYVPEDSEVYNFYGRSLGQNGQVFEGYLALAYGAMYSNNESRTKNWLGKAKKVAKSDQDKQKLEEAEAIYAKRKKYWK